MMTCQIKLPKQQLLFPSTGGVASENILKLNLGEKINPDNIYHLSVPSSPNLPKTYGGILCNLNDINTCPHLINDYHYLVGLEDNPSHMIKKVTYHFINYEGKVSIDSQLEKGVWRVSPYLLPLTYLLEYSDELKLELTVELDTQKKKFYQFTAVYSKNSLIDSLYFCLPTYQEEQVVEFIGKIWRIKTLETKPFTLTDPPKLIQFNDKSDSESDSYE